MKPCQSLKNWQGYLAKMIFSKVKQIILLGLFGFSLPYAYASPVILDIDASHHNGSQIGTFIGTELKKKFPDLEKQYDTYLNALVSTPQFKQLLPQIKNLKAVIKPVYQDEVNAIASAWQLSTQNNLGDGKLSIDEFWLLQLLADLTEINKGSAFAVANRKDHNPIAARNVDWKNSDALKSLQTITIYHYEDDRTVVNIGFAGLVSVINGFNDQGLFVSLMDASELETLKPNLVQHAASFALRDVLENMNRILPATQELAQKIYSRSLQILLADQEDVAVLEQPVGKTGRVRDSNGITVNNTEWHNNMPLAIVNCFVLKDSPRNCYQYKDYYRLGRFAQLTKKLDEQNVSVSDVMAIMQDQVNIRQAIFNEDTLQSIIFTPKDRMLYFSTPDAANTNAQPPKLEKYEFIKASPHSNDELVKVLLILGVAIVGVGFGFYFSRWQKHKLPLTVEKVKAESAD